MNGHHSSAPHACGLEAALRQLTKALERPRGGVHGPHYCGGDGAYGGCGAQGRPADMSGGFAVECDAGANR
ncbi:hypothetical protein [Xanthomonas theicola]|uniref:hypothetical protein n=1 Tax=Xanthomonas theicola TaxID=56464 RepID=UPI0011B056C9|nr:hypothetical protein [Xanthomonas theicola]